MIRRWCAVRWRATASSVSLLPPMPCSSTTRRMGGDESDSMAAVSPGLAAWGLMTGVAMVKSGLSVPLALLMGLTVYAGSAQLAVLPLMAVGAPLWVVWFTAICVNLRFVILSSMWRSYFANLSLRHRLAVAYFSGDVIFVNFMRRYPEARPQPEQLPYFWGAALTNWLATLLVTPRPLPRMDFSEVVEVRLSI